MMRERERRRGVLNMSSRLYWRCAAGGAARSSPPLASSAALACDGRQHLIQQPMQGRNGAAVSYLSSGSHILSRSQHSKQRAFTMFIQANVSSCGTLRQGNADLDAERVIGECDAVELGGAAQDALRLPVASARQQPPRALRNRPAGRSAQVSKDPQPVSLTLIDSVTTAGSPLTIH